MLISPTSPTSFGYNHLIPWNSEVFDDVTTIPITDEGARGNQNREVFAISTMTQRRATPFPFLGLPEFLVSERGQIIGIGIGNDDDGTPIAPIASVGASFGNIFFSAKRGHTGSTVAPFHENFDSIHKHNYHLWNSIDGALFAIEKGIHSISFTTIIPEKFHNKLL
jgi:hypothetical protein